jgi:hypothetical protein
MASAAVARFPVWTRADPQNRAIPRQTAAFALATGGKTRSILGHREAIQILVYKHE